jgi:hypothetical protein
MNNKVRLWQNGSLAEPKSESHLKQRAVNGLKAE